VSYQIANFYGVALAALGMLGTLSTALTIDAYGPISDNAGGAQPSLHCSGQRACEPTQPCLQEPPADLRLILTPLD
jgi:hypothetical protein